MYCWKIETTLDQYREDESAIEHTMYVIADTIEEAIRVYRNNLSSSIDVFKKKERVGHGSAEQNNN